MNIIDSSCWLEYFAGSKLADKVAHYIEDTEHLLVPTIVIYEVFKKLLIELDEDKALYAIAHLKQGYIVDIDADVAINAGKLGVEYKLPMADSIIYAIAKKYNATLWTQDKHFKDLPLVKYMEKE